LNLNTILGKIFNNINKNVQHVQNVQQVRFHRSSAVFTRLHVAHTLRLSINYFTTQPPGTLMHLSLLDITLKMPSRYKSASCFHNHSWTGIYVFFLLSWHRRPPKWLACFPNSVPPLVLCTSPPSMWWVDRRHYNHNVHTSIFEIYEAFSDILHCQYVVIIHLHQLTVDFDEGYAFRT
jgi:hypothetical protein